MPHNDLILVADHEENVRNLARIYLERASFRVLTAADGAEALAIFRREKPGLMMLALGLPEVTGAEVCRRIRTQSEVPIIVLTTRQDEVQRLIDLDLQADDYLTKPFNPRVLVAQAQAILGWQHDTPDWDLGAIRAAGNVGVDLVRRVVTINGRELAPRIREFNLLLALLETPNTLLSRDQLLDLAWGHEFYGQSRAVDVHMAHLSRRLEDSPFLIEAVPGRGYRLVAA